MSLQPRAFACTTPIVQPQPCDGSVAVSDSAFARAQHVHCLPLTEPSRRSSPRQVLSNKMTKSVTVAVTRTMRREGKYKELPYAYTRKFMVCMATHWHPGCASGGQRSSCDRFPT